MEDQKKKKKGLSVCIFGASGSGKTTLAKHLARTDGRRTLVVNCHDQKDYEDTDFEVISWEDSLRLNLSRCNIIFEDLITLAQKRTTLIKKFLYFLLRRKSIGLYFVSHEMYNSGLFSVIGQCDTVYVMSGSKNSKLLHDFLQRHPLEGFKPETFLPKANHCLKVDMASSSFSVLNECYEKATNTLGLRLEEKRKNVEALVKCVKHDKILMAIFDCIFKNIESDNLTANDLCLTVADSDGSHPRKIHIVDYLAALRSSARPSKDIARLKMYMDSLFVLPESLISNPHLQQPAKKNNK